MKQVAQNYRSGELDVIETPAPSCSPGGVIVRSLYSLISTGTEMMKVGESKMSLASKARSRPDQVKKVLDGVQQQGVLTTYKKAMDRLDSYSPLGYSLAGIVEEVGDGAEEFSVGQLVACAGNEFALHAELNWVPTNLCVAVRRRRLTPAGRLCHGGFHRPSGRASGQRADRGYRLCHRAGVGRTACRSAARGLRRSGGRPRSRPGPMPTGRKGRCSGLCGTGRRRRRQSRTGTLKGVRGAGCRSGVLSGRRTPPTSQWSWRQGSRATAQQWSISASASWTCLGTPTTRRSSTFGSPARTGQDVTTPRTSETESITHRATFDGRSGGISHCFIDAIARKEIDPEPLIAGIFSLDDAPSVYEAARHGRPSGRRVSLRVRLGSRSTSRRSSSDGTCRSAAPIAARPLLRTNQSARPLRSSGSLRIGFVGAGNYAASMLLPHLAKEQGVELAKSRPVVRCQPSTHNASSALTKPAPTRTPSSRTIRSTPSLSSPGTVRTPTWCAAPSKRGRQSSSRSPWLSPLTSSIGYSRRCDAPETTESWSGSTAASPPCL